MSQSILSVHKLSCTFETASVVNDVSFDVAEGDVLALIGPSGCGKTTTLRLIAGLEKLNQGEIVINGRPVAQGNLHIPTEKRNIGLIFQDYAIFPHLNVAQNVAFGLPKRDKSKHKRVDELLDLVGLAGLGERMPNELSGGQQQRVAIARALAPEPVVLLMDEPFSNLDATLRVEMRHEVRALLRRANMTAIFVTHDQEEALYMGDQIAVMNAGHLEQVGSPEDVYHKPASRFVASFMGNTDFMPGVVVANGLQTPLGTLPNYSNLPHGAKVDIALRADDVLVSEAKEQGEISNGAIVDKQFTGIANVYRVRLDNGTTVHSWQPHRVQLAAGVRVRAFVPLYEQLPCFPRT